MTKKKILIIEDDANIRDVLKLALDFEGYDISTANNGEEGFVALEKQSRPDLILLDLMMPVMTGWEFLEKFNNDQKLNKIPVVVVSAFSEKTKTIQCTAFVEKPLELETLLTTVRQYIA